jgi:hypothetical protein
MQWALTVAATLYLSYFGVLAHRRNARSWDSLAARLRTGEVAEIFVAVKTADALRVRLSSRNGLQAAYRGAGIALEMADYAERRAMADRGLVNALREDGIAVRLLALKQLLFKAMFSVRPR